MIKELHDKLCVLLADSEDRNTCFEGNIPSNADEILLERALDLLYDIKSESDNKNNIICPNCKSDDNIEGIDHDYTHDDISIKYTCTKCDERFEYCADIGKWKLI